LWPHIVQFSYVIHDTELNNIVDLRDYIIKTPTHVVISEESIKLHGITKERALKDGVDLNYVMDLFCNISYDYIIGHNLEFDVKMLIVEFYRLKQESDHDKSYDQIIEYFEKSQHFNSKCFCTMKNTVDICKIQTTRGYKYPKLSELHKHLFSVEPKNLHNSLFDVIITLRCFYKLIYEVDLREKNRTIRQMLR
jgi:DNA polymerase III epsilon subunit-like protein